MLKLGVLTRERFLSSRQGGAASGLLKFFSRGRVSFQLLETASQDSELFERLMPYIRLSSGTYRTTYRGRFRNLDPAVNQLLTTYFNSAEELRVEDWAASACLTSSEWAQSLFPLFPHLRFVASDILLNLVELHDSDGGVFIFEPGGEPLQFVRAPFVIRMTPPESWKLPVNYWICRKVWERWRFLNPMPAPVKQCIDSPSQEPLVSNGIRLTKLSLVHPEPERLAQSDARFATRCQSVFEPLSSAAHVIRTMNIFNRAYFSEEQLTKGTQAVLESLLPGGVWILGRTTQEDPPVHEVTILRKRDTNRLEVLKRLGSGSEIESLVVRSNAGA